MKIQKYVDKKNNNLYNKNHVNELSLYHDKVQGTKEEPFTPAEDKGDVP